MPRIFTSIVLIIVIVIGVRLLIRTGVFDTQPARQEINGEQWIKFQPDNGLFQIAFPTMPDVEMDALSLGHSSEGLIITTYSTFSDRLRTFQLRAVDYIDPKIGQAPEFLLTIVKEIATLSRDQELIHWVEGRHQGYRSIEATLDANGAILSYHGVHVGQRIYLLTYADSSEKWDEELFFKFVGSFKILKEQS